MKNERNARLGIRSRAEQFKYEQWFAKHLPDIDLLENKISPSMYRKNKNIIAKQRNKRLTNIFRKNQLKQGFQSTHKRTIC